jgi:hypothetical protein
MHIIWPTICCFIIWQIDFIRMHLHAIGRKINHRIRDMNIDSFGTQCNPPYSKDIKIKITLTEFPRNPVCHDKASYVDDQRFGKSFKSIASKTTAP